MKVHVWIALLIITAIAHGENIRPAALLNGVALHKRKRLQVRNIVVGNVTVSQLFQPVGETAPSIMDYYVTTASDTVTLRVIGPEQLQTLLETMAMQHTSTLKVILRDDRETFLRHVWPFDDSYFNAVREWTIQETPCEQITHIIYRKIRNTVRERFREGSTSRRVSLSAVFDLLVHDDIDKFLQSLGPTPTPPCLKTFQLYQWLKGEDVAGFAFGGYELTDDIRSSLRPVADALLDTHRDWQRYRLRIRIVGYADASKVQTKKDLRAEATGVKLRDPLDIRYLGCSDDTLISKAPHYVSRDATDGNPIGQQIVNNCQLGAARAYVAIAYFEELLGHQNVDYEYATGGVHPLATKRDAAHRKLDIDLDLRAASGEQ